MTTYNLMTSKYDMRIKFTLIWVLLLRPKFLAKVALACHPFTQSRELMQNCTCGPNIETHSFIVKHLHAENLDLDRSPIWSTISKFPYTLLAFLRHCSTNLLFLIMEPKAKNESLCVNNGSYIHPKRFTAPFLCANKREEWIMMQAH